MKFNRQRWGLYFLQAFAISVAGPALYHLCEPIFTHFKGNRAAIEYADTYVKDFDSLVITLPKNRWEKTPMGETSRTVAVELKKRVICVTTSIYYIAAERKYVEIIWTEGIDSFAGLYNRHYDAAGVQYDLLRPEMVLSVYVNRKQWKDKSYGTKEKPVPVFLHRIISGDNIEQRNVIAWKRDSLYPKGHFEYHYLPPHAVKRMRNTPDSVNRKFAGYYLRYVLPEEEFDRLFKKE